MTGGCNVLRHEINLVDPRLIRQNIRRIPFHQQEEVKKTITDIKEQNVIEESSSSWCSPAVMKRKKDGSIRFCINYRRLNDVTIKDSYPLPRINQVL